MSFIKPRFKSCYRVVPAGDDGLFLLYEGGYSSVTGRVYAQLAPYLTGEFDESELIQKVKGKVTAPEVFYALNQLEKRGLISEGAGVAEDNPADTWWELMRMDPEDVARQLRTSAVTLVRLDDRAASTFATALIDLGVKIVPTNQAAESNALEIVLVEDHLDPALAEINRRHLEDGTPWLVLKLVGMQPLLGPLFRPGQTGCWQCLAQRLEANRMVEQFLLNQMQEPWPAGLVRGYLPATMQAAAGLAAVEVAKTLGGENWFKTLDGAVVSLNTAGLSTERHELIKRPQCPACGDPSLGATPASVTLESRLKRFTADGGHRTQHPEQTYERLKKHVGQITGVVSTLVRAGESNTTILHAYIAGHNFSQTVPDIRSLRRTLRTFAGGKGMTDIQARVSAIGEAIERYAGVFRNDEPRIRSTRAALGHKAVDPRDLLQFSETQYAQRHESHGDKSLMHLVPEPYRDDMELDWTPVWSLTNHVEKYVPTQFCYYNYGHIVGLKPQEMIALADSNGCAAGNTMEEALLQGFMEVVERDAVAVFWYNRLRRPAVDLASFNDPFIAQMVEYFARINRDLWVLDITNDIGIPAFCGVTWRTDRPDGQPQEVIVGFGAHLDAKLALMRALTECNQFLAGFERAGETDQRYMGFDSLATRWWKMATLENQPYLVPDPNVPLKRASDYPQLASQDLRDDVLLCVERMSAQGLETLVLNQTRPDVDLNVAKVIVPGARHFWQRLGPGRLYDVPVKMGWLPAPLKEEEMNPFPVFF